MNPPLTPAPIPSAVDPHTVERAWFMASRWSAPLYERPGRHGPRLLGSAWVDGGRDGSSPRTPLRTRSRERRPLHPHIKEWLAGLQKAGLSASRARTAYRVLSQIFALAVDNDLIAVTPCRGIKLPRLPETEPHILSTREVERLIAHVRPPHDLLVKLLAYAGLRIGEAFALRRKDVDLTNGLIWVDEALPQVAGQVFFDTPKSHQKRPLSLPAYLVRELRDHLTARVADDPEALLFLGRTGRPLRYNSWRRTHFDKAVDRAGLKDVTPQDLRATHASQVADRFGVMAAAKRLGHSNASLTTRHYARSRDGQDAEIAKGLNADHEKAKRARARKAKKAKLINGDVARTLHDEKESPPRSDDQGG